MKFIFKKTESYLIIGGKSPKMGRLIELAKKREADSHLIFTGFVADADLPLYYAAADISVFHSIYETHGISLLEAMASEKPMVRVRSTAIPETIEDGRNGIIIEPLNPPRLAEAFFTLLQAPEKRQRFWFCFQRKGHEKIQRVSSHLKT